MTEYVDDFRDLVSIGAIDYDIALPYLQRQNKLEFAKQLIRIHDPQQYRLCKIYSVICRILWVDLFHHVVTQFPMKPSDAHFYVDERYYVDCLKNLCLLRKCYASTTQLKRNQVQIAHMILRMNGVFYEDDHIRYCLENEHFTLASYILSHGKHAHKKSKQNVLSDIIGSFYHREKFERISEFCFVNGFDYKYSKNQHFYYHAHYLTNKHIKSRFSPQKFPYKPKMFSITDQFVCRDISIFTCKFVGIYLKK